MKDQAANMVTVNCDNPDCGESEECRKNCLPFHKGWHQIDPFKDLERSLKAVGMAPKSVMCPACFDKKAARCRAAVGMLRRLADAIEKSGEAEPS